MQDLNQNMQSDYMDALDRIKESEEFRETMNLQTQKESSRSLQAAEKLQLSREKMQADMAMKKIDLDIARENQTRAELIADKKIKEQKKNKKK